MSSPPEALAGLVWRAVINVNERGRFFFDMAQNQQLPTGLPPQQAPSVIPPSPRAGRTSAPAQRYLHSCQVAGLSGFRVGLGLRCGIRGDAMTGRAKSSKD